LKDYFTAGAKWTAAPKPQLLAAQYDASCSPWLSPPFGPCYVTTEFEPTFDAADIIHCGQDLLVQRSHVTNQLGIEWLQRHLGDQYRLHLIRSRDPGVIHLDTTLMPLAPGKLLVNPEYVDVNTLPTLFRNWDILVAPQPTPTSISLLGTLGEWISMNVLSLDEQRVIVEAEQIALIQALRDWGFQPIPCSFTHCYPFGGSFHCFTLDIRRAGKLKCYEF
jgi:glycine amidinotransferase